MKKLLSLLLCLCMAVTMVGATAEGAPFTPGVYETSAQGNNGAVTVATELDGTSILSVQIKAHSETPSIGDAAIETMPARIVLAQSLDVDTVTGATNTSKAILNAVEQALTLAGGSKDDLTAQAVSGAQAQQMKDEQTDVVIVGAGGAGMAAAIEAKTLGLDVILIEKLAMVGGTTALASTAYNAGGTSVQLALETPYTADDYYKKLLGTATEDNASLRRLADLSGADGDWLIGMGADLSRVINGSQHTPADGSALGAMLVPVLSNQLKALSIDCRVSTKAVELVMDGAKVTGVKVESENGAYTIFASAVILATGGFASNPDMVAQYTPMWAGYPSTASVGATGDGVTLALSAGAALENMEKAGPQTVAYDTGNGAVSLTNVRYNGAILVNAEGKRFVNELANTTLLGSAITQQTNGNAYLIFDQAAVDNAALMETYKAKGYFTQADTLEELAKTLEIPADALAASVETYQKYYDAGEDAEFGRKDSMFTRLETAPYYGVKISPASQTTYGGIKIDLDCRALTESGEVIQGLYAAGEAACQSGQGVTIAIVLGRLSADTVFADLGNR